MAMMFILLAVFLGFISFAQSAFPNCMYVTNPRWVNPSNGTYGEEHDGGIIPIGYCESSFRTDKENGVYSEYFMCTPWDEVYVLYFDGIGCAGSPSYIQPVISGDYNCNTPNLCDIWHVSSSKSSPAPNCMLNATNYDELLMVENECYIASANESYIMTCDSSTGDVTYYKYDNPGCIGNTVIAIDTISGQCHIDDEDPSAHRYVELIDCGPTPQPALSPTTCSFIINPVWIETDESGGSSYSYNNSREGALPMADDICISEYRLDTSYNGTKSLIYRSRMYICDQSLQLPFVAEWNTNGHAGCDGEPDIFAQIIDHSGFECSVDNGPCDYMILRHSDIPKLNGTNITTDCGFGKVNGTYGEQVAVPGMCYANNDGDSNITNYVSFDCDIAGMNITYSIFNTSDCSGTPIQSLEGDTDTCLDTGNNYAYIQLAACKGYEAVTPPDCNYILNPEWKLQSTNTENENGYKPIGICDGENKQWKGVTSQIFVCMPWNKVFIMHYSGVTDCSGHPDYIAEIESHQGFECNANNDCDVFWVKTSDVANGSLCQLNSTDYESTLWVEDTCWSGGDGDGINSVYASCSNAGAKDMIYSVYNALDCGGDPVQTININSGDCSNSTGGPGYIEEVVPCGPVTTINSYSCSFVVGAVWNVSIDNNTKTVHSGMARPLSTDICLTSSKDNEFSSTMFWCDDVLQVGFVAQWINSTGCSGDPSYVSIIDEYSALECNNVAGPCDYALIRTASYNDTVTCEFQDHFEEVAIVTDYCFTECDNDTGDCFMLYIQCDVDRVRYVEYDATTGGATCDVMDWDTNSLEHIIVDNNNCSVGLGPEDQSDSNTLLQIDECTNPVTINYPTVQPTSDPTEAPTTSEPTPEPTEILIIESSNTTETTETTKTTFSVGNDVSLFKIYTSFISLILVSVVLF